jgi:hypothetical protein
LKSFAFCRRAWLLERQDMESALVGEQVRGRANHVTHGQIVQMRNEDVAATVLRALAASTVNSSCHFCFGATRKEPYPPSI